MFVRVDDLLTAHEKPPVGSKDVVVSISVAKDLDSDSCPSKTNSNQSIPLIIRDKEGKDSMKEVYSSSQHRRRAR